jgi:ABC-2 type transport system permease protein
MSAVSPPRSTSAEGTATRWGDDARGSRLGRTDRSRRAALPSTARLALDRTRVELLQFFRERDAVIFIFAYPIIMLAIFATVFGQDGATVGPEPGIPFGQYFLPGMVATGVLLSSFQNLAISIAVERDEGGLKRLRGTPMPPAAYFLGKVGSVLVTSAVQMALLLAVAAVVFGIELPSEPGRWATFAWVFALGTASGAICGVAFSSVPRSGRSASAVVTPVVIVLQFISGVFFVFASLPGWMQQVASLFPLKWMAQGMRSVFLPDQALALEPAGSWEHGRIATVLGLYLLVGLAVGIRTFRWRRRDDG